MPALRGVMSIRISYRLQLELESTVEIATVTTTWVRMQSGLQ